MEYDSDTGTPTSEPHDATSLRDAMRTFATGVTVVTSAGGASVGGVTVNAFTSASLIPPLVLVCLGGESSGARMIACNRVFAVNVLSADQAWIARRFASPTRPRGSVAFTGVPHRQGLTGAPILTDVVCSLECIVTQMLVAGDHVIAIGEVVGVDHDPGREALIFHAGRYRVARDATPASRAPVASLIPTHPKGGDDNEEAFRSQARDREDHGL